MPVWSGISELMMIICPRKYLHQYLLLIIGFMNFRSLVTNIINQDVITGSTLLDQYH